MHIVNSGILKVLQMSPYCDHNASNTLWPAGLGLAGLGASRAGGQQGAGLGASRAVARPAGLGLVSGIYTMLDT